MANLSFCVTQLFVQVGTAVVTRQDKRLALGRLGSLVEQIEALVSKDRQVILVRTSSSQVLKRPGSASG